MVQMYEKSPMGGVKSKEIITYINFTSSKCTTDTKQAEKHPGIYRQQAHGRPKRQA